MLPTNPDELAAILRLKLPSNEKLDTTSLRYVIYARKSTDEKEKQVHSTEDQVAVCVEYAQHKKMDIKRCLIFYVVPGKGLEPS